MMEVHHNDPETGERLRKLFLIGGKDNAEIARNLRDAYNEAMDGIPNVVKLTQQRIGRNDPCPCGSGKKLKKCCLWKLHAKPMVPITPYAAASGEERPDCQPPGGREAR